MLAASLNENSICQQVDNDSIADKQQQSKNTDKHNVAQKGMNLGKHFFFFQNILQPVHFNSDTKCI